MTSSGTGQSSSVDVTHSLWRMTNPPCRIVALLPLMTLYVWGTDVSSCSFSDVQIVATYGRWLGLACGRPSRRAQSFEARAPSGARAPQDEVVFMRRYDSNLGNAVLGRNSSPFAYEGGCCPPELPDGWRTQRAGIRFTGPCHCRTFP